MSPLVECKGLDVAYGPVQVLFGVDFTVDEGEIVALLGTNGAGKSTLLKAISGLMAPAAGTVTFDGRDITGADAEVVTRAGVSLMPGGKGIFPTVTVDEHLRLAAWTFRKDAPRIEAARADSKRALSFRNVQAARRRCSSTVTVGKIPLPPGMSETPARVTASASAPVMSRPSRVIRPAAGSRSPEMALSSVDLPAPLVPRSATISPRSTCMSTPNSTCVLP